MGKDDYLLREAEHKELVAEELERSPEAAVKKEAERHRQAAAELRSEWERRQQPEPAPVAVATEENAGEMSYNFGVGPEDEDPEMAALREYIIETIRTCYDPEIPINIYDLGLIYDITITPPGMVSVVMTLTAPGCPVAGILPGEVENKVRAVPGVVDVKLELTWQPPWDQSRMSPAGRLQLGIDW